MKIAKGCIVEAACSTDKDRRPLAHPYLDLTKKDKPVVVSTDGVMMAIVPVETHESDTTGHLNRSALAAARRKLKKKDETLTVWLEDQMMIYGDGTKTLRIERNADGSLPGFPNWRQVAPPNQGDIVLYLDAHKLKRLADAMGTHGVKLRAVDRLSPITVTPIVAGTYDNKFFPVEPLAIGVIMPCRAE